MNNLVIYNEAEINSVEICVLPPLFKVKVAMDSDIVCPDCGTRGKWTEPRDFNMMLRTHLDRKSTRLNSSHSAKSRMPSSA